MSIDVEHRYDTDSRTLRSFAILPDGREMTLTVSWRTPAAAHASIEAAKVAHEDVVALTAPGYPPVRALGGRKHTARLVGVLPSSLRSRPIGFRSDTRASVR